MTYTIPQIPVTAMSIGTTDLLEIAQGGSTSAQIAWSSILGTAQTWTAVQTFVAPVLGAATCTTMNKITITQPASGATLTIANGATLTVSANATVSGTNTGDSGTVTSVATDGTLTGGPITGSGTLGINVASANAWTAIQTVTPTGGSANTNADAVILGTLGAATATTTQYDSGSLRLTCSAWKSTATAAPQLNDWIIYALPVTGTSVSTSILRFDCQNEVTGGGYFQGFGIVSTITGGGSVLVGNSAGSGAVWLGSTSLTSSAVPVLVGNGTTTTISSAGTSGNINLRNSTTTVLSIQPSGTLASATSLTWNGVFVPALTVTLSGSTAITTATGLNLTTITAPVFSTASTIAVTAAATVAITGPPTITGASSTITSAAAFWVQSGSTVLGNSAIATNATSGFVYLPSCAGAATGTPQAFGAAVPIVFDTTDGKMYAYYGGAMHFVAFT
jgi:hypothetical protein